MIAVTSSTHFRMSLTGSIEGVVKSRSVTHNPLLQAVSLKAGLMHARLPCASCQLMSVFHPLRTLGTVRAPECSRTSPNATGR